MTVIDASLAELCAENTLNQRLSDILRGVQDRDAAVGVSVGDRTSIVAIDPVATFRNPSEYRVHPGCIFKLITCSMLEDLLSTGYFSRITVASDVFGIPRTHFPWAQLRVGDFTDHTHGLDDRDCGSLSHSAGAAIDFEYMSSVLSRPSITAPGELYSYSHAGAWLSAAALERFHQRSYLALLKQRHSGLELEDANSEMWSLQASVSPATGRGVTVSIGGLLRFLNFERERRDFWTGSGEYSYCTPLSGWNPMERGIYRGWKIIGDGWFGHSSNNEDGSTVVVRIHPTRRISIIVSSRRHAANIIAAKLFGRAMPCLAQAPLPRILRGSLSLLANFSELRGTYRNGHHTLSILSDEQLGLKLYGQDWCVPLVATDREIMFAPGAESRGVSFVQGVKRRGQRFDYLWDGRRLFRNLESPPTVSPPVQTASPCSENSTVNDKAS